jgi:hypothetical protein
MALVGIGMMPMPNKYYASFAGGGGGFAYRAFYASHTRNVRRPISIRGLSEALSDPPNQHQPHPADN